MKVDKLIPKRRFKEFENDEAWEQRKLTDSATLFGGLTYSPNNIVKEKGTLVLRSSNVKNGEVVDADNVYVNPEVVNVDNVRIGDIIVVVRNGSRSLIGKHAQIKSSSDNTVIGAFMSGLRSNHPEFINALLDTKLFKAEIDKNLGATINQITNGMFNQMNFLMPSEKEQEAIGSFFKTLDNLITLHQRKLNKLKETKSAYLSEMFPKEGEIYPKRRFAGFTDPWEQRKLGEITESFSGGTPSVGNSQYYGGTIPFIRSGEISSVKTELFVTEVGLNNSSAKMVKVGDVLYALYGATSGEVSISRINGAINQAILAIRSTRNDDHYFIGQWLRMQKEQIIATYLQGGQGNLSGSIVKELMIALPVDKREQKLISSFLSNLDNLITLHKRKLEKLENLKKAYLNEMFV